VITNPKPEGRRRPVPLVMASTQPPPTANSEIASESTAIQLPDRNTSSQPTQTEEIHISIIPKALGRTLVAAAAAQQRSDRLEARLRQDDEFSGVVLQLTMNSIMTSISAGLPNRKLYMQLSSREKLDAGGWEEIRKSCKQGPLSPSGRPVAGKRPEGARAGCRGA